MSLCVRLSGMGRKFKNLIFKKIFYNLYFYIESIKRLIILTNYYLEFFLIDFRTKSRNTYFYQMNLFFRISNTLSCGTEKLEEISTSEQNALQLFLLVGVLITQN